MNRYSYLSEKQALSIEMKMFLTAQGDCLLEFYLNNGFEKLAEKYNFEADWQKKLLFDYLMLERKALLICLRRNKAFFLKLISEGRGQLIRPMLGVTASQYDGLWREALDLLSLYFAEKKVIEKMTNEELAKFLEQSIFGGNGKGSSSSSRDQS